MHHPRHTDHDVPHHRNAHKSQKQKYCTRRTGALQCTHCLGDQGTVRGDPWGPAAVLVLYKSPTPKHLLIIEISQSGISKKSNENKKLKSHYIQDFLWETHENTSCCVYITFFWTPSDVLHSSKIITQPPQDSQLGQRAGGFTTPTMLTSNINRQTRLLNKCFFRVHLISSFCLLNCTSSHNIEHGREGRNITLPNVTISHFQWAAIIP